MKGYNPPVCPPPPPRKNEERIPELDLLKRTHPNLVQRIFAAEACAYHDSNFQFNTSLREEYVKYVIDHDKDMEEEKSFNEYSENLLEEFKKETSPGPTGKDDYWFRYQRWLERKLYDNDIPVNP